MKRAIRVLLGLIVGTALLARSAGALVIGSAASNGVAIQGSDNHPLFGEPSADWDVDWSSGPNTADELLEDDHLTGTELKLQFDGTTWDPAGRTFTGYTHTFGPGQYHSSSYTSGYGFSSSRYVDSPTGVGRDFVPIIDLTANADGFLGPPVPGHTQYWASNSTAEDPIILHTADFADVPGPTTDLFISLQIHSVKTTGGRIDLHAWYETATATTELVEIILTPTGASVVAGDPSASYVVRDSLGQGVPKGTDPRIDANGLRTALLGKMSGDSLSGPFTFYVVLANTPVPTQPMLAAGAPHARAVTALAAGDAVAKFHMDLSVFAEAAGAGRFVQPFSNVALPPEPISYVAIPERAPIVDIAFDPLVPMAADGDVALYEHSPAGWMLRTNWEWNGGTVRSFVPSPGAHEYALVGCGNQYPIPFHVTFPLNTHSPTPPTPSTMPDFALGALDYQLNPFNPVIGFGQGGMAPPLNINPGLAMQTVPRNLGVNHWQYQPLQCNFQPDPTRPWLYLNNNPSLGLAQPTFVNLNLDGLFDAIGNPIANLPIEVDLYQGPTQTFFQGNAHYDQNGRVVFPPINLGSLLAQPFTIVIGVPGSPAPASAGPARVTASGFGVSSAQTLPGYFSMNGIIVNNGNATITGVDPAGPVAVTALALEPPSPNPSRGEAQIAFSTVRAERVRVGVYDLGGREVRRLLDGPLDPGRHHLAWDGQDQTRQRVNPGVYFIRVHEGTEIAMRKIALVR